MYLPFLRGKLFELKAIKEFIAESKNRDSIGHFFMPIIEPVNRDLGPLKNCVNCMIDAKVPFSVILNSKLGDYKRMSFDCDSFLAIDSLKGYDKFFPAFEVSNNVIEIDRVISEHGLKNVMLIFLYGIDYEDLTTQELLNSESVSYVGVLSLSSNRTLLRRLKAFGKKLITIDDRFIPQSSNWEYRNNIDELFTDIFSYYKEDGFFGFSDFTVLPRNYREGGVLPPYVAIHITYKKNPEEIYVHHFVSESGNGTSNIRGEFMEANRKIPPFFIDKQTTIAIRQLTSSDYPGLGAIKKYSIKNHFELLSKIFEEVGDEEAV